MIRLSTCSLTKKAEYAFSLPEQTNREQLDLGAKLVPIFKEKEFWKERGFYVSVGPTFSFNYLEKIRIPSLWHFETKGPWNIQNYVTPPLDLLPKTITKVIYIFIVIQIIKFKTTERTRNTTFLTKIIFIK